MKKHPLLPILLVAAALRAYKLDMTYWVDELVTRERGSGSLWEACTRAPYPLTDILAWFTQRLSDTEWALRLPSALAGVAGVAAMYWAASKAAGRRAGLFAALLLALSPFHIEHSQDARYYAILILITAASLGVLIDLASRLTWQRLAAFAGLTALGLLTHPFYALAAAGMTAAYAIHLLTVAAPWPARLKRVAMAGFATAAGILPPALLIAPRLFGAVATTPADPEAAVGASARPLYRLTLGEYGAYILDAAGGGLLAAAVLALAAAGAAVLLRKKSPTAFAAIALLMLPLPLLFIDVKHWYHSRYFSYLLPAVALCAGAGIDGIIRLAAGRRVRLHRALAAAAVAVVLLGSAAPLRHYYRAHCPRDHWGRAARLIAARMNPGDVVFHASTYSMQPGNNQYRSRVMEHYLMAAQPAGATRTWISCSGADAKSLADTIKKFPEKTIWIAADHDMIGEDLSELIARTCAPLAFGTPWLYVLGAPTRNLIAGGGFEEPFQLPADTEGLALAPAASPACGANCLAIANRKPDGHCNITLPLAEPLQPGQAYTLSVELKLRDVRPGSNPSRVCKVVLSGKRPDGKEFWHELLRLRGTEDWRRYVMPVMPGGELPEGAQNVALRIGLFGGTGDVWVDNVQLERKPWPTPFVQGERQARSE